MTIRFLDSLDELPSGARLLFYGAGAGGSRFLRRVRSERPDLRPLGFVDDHRPGVRDGLPIHPPEALPALASAVDRLVVTSAYWREISATLGRLWPGEAWVARPGLYFPEHFFTDGELEAAAGPLAAARALLDKPHPAAGPVDRALFDALVENRSSAFPAAPDPLELFRNGPGAPRAGIYLDFLDLGRIRTVVEGGVLDGADTLRFLDRLPALEAVHGFEPQPEAWRNGPHRARLAAEPRAILNDAALWSGNARLPFFADPDTPDGSRLGEGADGAGNRTVDAVALDDYVARRGLASVDLIKLDIEGAELEALKGAAGTIRRFRPQLAISVYHRKRDLHEIPLFLAGLLPGSVHRLGHYTRSFWDTVWYVRPG